MDKKTIKSLVAGLVLGGVVSYTVSWLNQVKPLTDRLSNLEIVASRRESDIAYRDSILKNYLNNLITGRETLVLDINRFYCGDQDTEQPSFSVELRRRD